jgi:hypothetical protein
MCVASSTLTRSRAVVWEMPASLPRLWRLSGRPARLTHRPASRAFSQAIRLVGIHIAL